MLWLQFEETKGNVFVCYTSPHQNSLQWRLEMIGNNWIWHVWLKVESGIRENQESGKSENVTNEFFWKARKIKNFILQNILFESLQTLNPLNVLWRHFKYFRSVFNENHHLMFMSLLSCFHGCFFRNHLVFWLIVSVWSLMKCLVPFVFLEEERNLLRFVHRSEKWKIGDQK